MVKFTKVAMLFLGLALLMAGWSSLPAFTLTGWAAVPCNTEFAGTTLDAGFSTYIPRTGPSFSLTANPGYLRLSIPDNASFDHWSHLDEAPQLRCAAPSGTFELTTRVKVVAPSGADLNYHVGLLIVFGQLDAIYWGSYKGNEIRMERSGQRPGIVTTLDNPNRELELKIERQLITAGYFYTFSYRFVGQSEWKAVGSYFSDDTPRYVGVIGKTWSPVRLLADFDYLHVN